MNFNNGLTPSAQELKVLRQKLIDAKSCFGITSKTQDNKHIVMLDFDNISLKNVEDTINKLISDYNMSTFYVIESTNGYNAFSLSKYSFNELVFMLSGCEFVDSLFVKLAVEKRGFFVLRMGYDKKFIKRIINPISPNRLTLSYAHYLFFRHIMNYHVTIGNIQTAKLYYDMYTKFIIISYKSVKHGIADVEYKDNRYLEELKNE